MKVIQGTNVDLIYPFPIGEIERFYGWNHCYRTITTSDDSPQGMEETIGFLRNLLAICPSWGIIDKNNITSSRTEAPIIGILMFEPRFEPGSLAVRNGYFHVATARKAWRTGLVDEAGQLVLREVFDQPSLLRVSAYIMDKNAPAKSLAKRMGFKFEGVVEDAILKDGAPENMVMFGLTRRNYDLCQKPLEH